MTAFISKVLVVNVNQASFVPLAQNSQEVVLKEHTRMRRVKIIVKPAQLATTAMLTSQHMRRTSARKVITVL